MDKIRSYIASRWIVLLMMFVFFLIRLPGLDSTFLLYDERDTVLTQYSLAKTGNDLYGNKTPLKFDRISPHAPALAMYYGVPYWFTGLKRSVTNARLIYMLPASIIPLLIFELLFAILKRKDISLIASLIFSFSPWIYHVSRLALEINLAFPVFLGAVLFQVKRKYMASFFLYGLSFFLYQGIRPLIPAAFIYFELFLNADRKKINKSFTVIAVFLAFTGLMLIAAFITEGNMQTRGSSEVVFFATERIAKEVDSIRSSVLFPTALSNLFINKLSIMSDYIAGNLYQGLNLTYLFNNGDSEPIYSNAITGQFVPALSIFLLLGLLTLGRARIKEYYIFAGITLLGLIPSLINIYSSTFAIRALFSGVGLSFIMALGVKTSFGIISNKKRVLKYSFYGILVLAGIFQSADFAYKYILIRPKIQAELFNESERKLAALLASSETTNIIRLANPFSYFLSYAFLEKDESFSFGDISQSLNGGSGILKIKNSSFISCKAKSIETANISNTNIIDESCLSEAAKSTLETSVSKGANAIMYSDSNPLRSGNGIKFYIFD